MLLAGDTASRCGSESTTTRTTGVDGVRLYSRASPQLPVVSLLLLLLLLLIANPAVRGKCSVTYTVYHEIRDEPIEPFTFRTAIDSTR